jgi:O-antigen/teichoic acid export membrane protein
LIFVIICSTIIINIDKVLIQLFWSAEQGGFYFSAYKLTAFINIFSLAVGTLLFPTFSELHFFKNIRAVHNLILKSERYLSMIVFPMVFGMLALAQPAGTILISGWSGAIPILQILPLFVLFAALERPYQSHFLGSDQPKIARNRVIIMVCINVLLNIILIPQDIQSLGIPLMGMGARGAAIATVISYLVGLFYSRIVFWKLSKTKGSYRILLHAFAAGLMALLLYWFNSIFIIDRWFYLLGFAFLGLAVYIFILFLVGEFKKKDIIFFIDTLNLKKMLQYIKGEIRRK